MGKLPPISDLELTQRCRRERVVDMARRFGVSREAIYRRLRGQVKRPSAAVDNLEYESNLGALIGLVRAGYRSGDAIAKALNISRSMAYKWIRRAVEEGHLERPAGKRGAVMATGVGDYMVIADEVDGALVPHRKK